MSQHMVKTSIPSVGKWLIQYKTNMSKTTIQFNNPIHYNWGVLSSISINDNIILTNLRVDILGHDFIVSLRFLFQMSLSNWLFCFQSVWSSDRPCFLTRLTTF